jgi:WD40 repeat protein
MSLVPQYSLEGHQFAVFGFCLTSDLRYIVSISNKFITWDLSTSDLTRDVNPGIEGIMQQLVLSPDDRFAAAYTSNNQVSGRRDACVLRTISSPAWRQRRPLMKRNVVLRESTDVSEEQVAPIIRVEK